jgi:hypothetical protein
MWVVRPEKGVCIVCGQVIDKHIAGLRSEIRAVCTCGVEGPAHYPMCVPVKKCTCKKCKINDTNRTSENSSR